MLYDTFFIFSILHLHDFQQPFRQIPYLFCLVSNKVRQVQYVQTDQIKN